MEHGVPEDRIIFINLVCLRAFCGVGAARAETRMQISSPEGLKSFCTKYPALRVVRVWSLACCWRPS